MRCPLRLVLPVLGLVGTTPTVLGQLVAYDGFNYTAGTALHGANGGTGWAGGWSGKAPNSLETAEASSLSYGSVQNGYLSTTGGAAYFTPNSGLSGLSFTRNFATPLGATSGTWYLSFLMDYDGSGGMETYIYTGSGATAFYFGRFFGDFENVVAKKDLAVATLGPANQNTNLFVVRMDLGGGSTAGTSRITFYVNPAISGSTLATATLDNVPTFDVGGFGLVLRTPIGNGIHLDEVRLGRTYDDVVPISAIPEPSSWAAILGLCAAALAVWKRNRPAPQLR